MKITNLVGKDFKLIIILFGDAFKFAGVPDFTNFIVQIKQRKNLNEGEEKKEIENCQFQISISEK